MTIHFALKRVESPVAYCAMSIRTGTRYEDPQYNGLAHLTEHMLFKGTEKRTSKSINSVLESEGGELNAYTTKEEIVLYSTQLVEDLPKAIDLMAELAFTSTFPKRELKKELDVIYDEIISYKDSPSDSIYDDFESLLFKGHPLEKTILGEKETLCKIGSETLLEFLRTNFRPDNLFFTIVGNTTAGSVKRSIGESLKLHFHNGQEETPAVLEISDLSESNIGEDTKPEESPQEGGKSMELLANKRFQISRKKHNHQAHCIIGCTAYSYYEGWRRIALSLLTNILGGPSSNSLLNMSLREKHALVYSIDATYTPYSDTGIFSIYFGCDKSLLPKCRELVYAELKKIVEKPLSAKKLESAKKQFVGQLLISQDNAEAQCLAMGKSLMVFNKLQSFEKTHRDIEKITARQLQEVAAEILATERLSELIYR